MAHPPFPTSLLRLPVELLCDVLGYVDVNTLLLCSLVNRHLSKVIRGSSCLQYTIELAKCRMSPAASSSVSSSYAHRLQHLQQRESMWKSLAWKNPQKVDLPQTGSVYEFMGGIYANGRESDTKSTASISFYELVSSGKIPGVVSAAEQQTWSHYMDDLSIIDFTMDPNQDLLVLVAHAPQSSNHIYELHLRTLSTNAPHPKAAMPILTSFLRPMPNGGNAEHTGAVRIQVSGDLIGFLIKEAFEHISGHLQIWNWETGPNFSCSLVYTKGIDDFTFLSQDSFLLVRPKGTFEVYTFKNPETSSNKPVLRGIYMFPSLTDGYHYWYISLSSNPSPGFTTPPRNTGKATMKAGLDSLYYPTPEDRMISCCLYVFRPTSMDVEHEVHSFVFFVSVKFFLDNITTPLSVPIADLKKTGSASSVNSLSSSASSSTSEPSTNGLPVTLTISGSEPVSSLADHISQLGDLPPDHPSASSNPPAASSSTTSSPGMPPPNNPVDRNRSYGAMLQIGLRRLPKTRQTDDPIPWEFWGPPNTRWFHECMSTDWQHALYGLRTAEGISLKKFRNSGIAPSLLGGGLILDEDPDIFSEYVDLEGKNPSPPAVHALLPGAPNLGVLAAVDVNDPGAENDEDGLSVADRYLRIRDYNPYRVRELELELSSGGGKGKDNGGWRCRRVVKGPSTICSRGVFKHNITSSLPYTEVVSKEQYDVTDVMIDDSRLLLLKRGQSGKLRSIDVLTV